MRNCQDGYKNNDACIGILGRDSDYLIYQTGGVPLLSITDLDILTLKTKLYDPRRLASWLDLRTSQLPLFAILAGNTAVDKEWLVDFHTDLVGPYRRNDVSVLFPVLAMYIRDERLEIISDLGNIARNIFQDEFKTKLLEDTIQDYFLDLPTPPEKTLDYNDSNWNQILGILGKMEPYLILLSGNITIVLMPWRTTESPTEFRQLVSSGRQPDNDSTEFY